MIPEGSGPIGPPQRAERSGPVRRFHHQDFDLEWLRSQKGGQRITVALPARNEAPTIGAIVEAIRSELTGPEGIVDELIVIDDHSSDDTAAQARSAGATVIPAASVLPEIGRGPGKGEALWRSLHVAQGDIICWCDADIRNYDNRFIVGILGPLLTEPDVHFVKGFYQRPLRDDGEGGGRVTELMARPLISRLFPQLGELVQPLAGEFGGRTNVLRQLRFSRGYAVDLALLIDLSVSFGADIIAQVDLGTRIHRNRPLRELGPQAAAILAMAVERAGFSAPRDESDQRWHPDDFLLQRPTMGDATIAIGDLPPLNSLTD